MTVTVQVKRSREFEFDPDRTTPSSIKVRAIECGEKTIFTLRCRFYQILKKTHTKKKQGQASNIVQVQYSAKFKCSL